MEVGRRPKSPITYSTLKRGSDAPSGVAFDWRRGWVRLRGSRRVKTAVDLAVATHERANKMRRNIAIELPLLIVNMRLDFEGVRDADDKECR